MYRWPIQKHSMFLPILYVLGSLSKMHKEGWRKGHNTIPLKAFQRAISHHSPHFMKGKRRGEN